LPESAKKPEPAGMWMNEEAAVEDLPPSAEVGVETGPTPPGATPVPATPAPSEPPPPRPHFSESSADIEEATPAVSLPEMAPPAEAPEGGRRLGGPLCPVVGDERREEARRFARLLVSEIKLYNERAVLEGREGGNLYQRLKEDIDRSRQMYDE